jgi:hypothetical protein
MNKIILLITSCLLANTLSFAQGNLLDELDEPIGKKEKTFTTATFKTSRLINAHSIEQTGEGILDFKINHRFGTLNGGGYQLWGLDNATMRMAFDYGLKPWLTIGIGRSTFEKTYDGFVKASILRQTNDKKGMPISLVFATGMAYKTLRGVLALSDNVNRLSYAHQLLVARKFSKTLSVQLMPTLIHQNVVPLSTDPNNQLSMGMGGRYKLSRSISLNAEYFYQLPSTKIAGTTNTLSVGCDIETGGHVFQLHVTNSRGMVEPVFAANNTGTWANGDILFGFNISRVFTVKRPKTF